MTIGNLNPSRSRDPAPEARYCMCGTRLSRYNKAKQCYACAADVFDPIVELGLPPDKDYVTAYCENCGIALEDGHDHRQRFCSDACRRRAWQIKHATRYIHQCERCAEWFAQEMPNQRFCSAECREVAKAGRRQAKREEGYDWRVARPCPGCSSVFTPKRSNQVACSPKCADRVRRNHADGRKAA